MRVLFTGLVFRCKECNKEFKSRSGLTWHMKRHSGLVFSCHVCGKKYSQKQPLQRHLDSVHYGKRKTSVQFYYPISQKQISR